MGIRKSWACLLCAALVVVGCVMASSALAARTPSPVTPSFALGPDGFGISLPAGNVTNELCTGDFNGDGNEDVAAALTGSGHGIDVALGDGTGHLGPLTPRVTLSGTTRCAAGDFNHDGRTDLAVVQPGATGVTIALGQADGTFITSSVTTPANTTDVAVGDFNGDGNLDLVVGMSDSTLGEWFGDGAGGFTAATGSPFSVGLVPTFIKTDGHSQVVMNDTTGNATAAVAAGPSGTFGTALTVSPAVSGLLDMGDIDGDGRPDFLTKSGGHQVQTVFGQGGGAFTVQTCTNGHAPCDPNNTSQIDTVVSGVMGDFNNDGILDAAVSDDGGAHNGEGDIWTMAGTGASDHSADMFDPTAEGPWVVSPSAFVFSTLATGDFNNDGRLDIVVASTTKVAVVLNNTPVPAVTTGAPTSVGGDHATVAGIVGASGLTTSFGVDLISAGGAISRQPAVGTLSGTGTSTISIPVTGLTPQTAYSYRVYATNADGTTVGQIKSFTTQVAGPANTSPPQISGIAQAGTTLTCQPGSWTGSPSFAFQWLRAGSPIAGQTASTYTVTASDVASALDCEVTATNPGGSVTAATPTVVAEGGLLTPPQNLASPHVANLSAPKAKQAQVGQVLACAAGTWSAGGSFTYAWLRNGKAIAKATDSGYVVTAADAGKSLTCAVTVTNRAGHLAAKSNAVKVAPPPCVVPNLHGKSLAQAKRALAKAHCKLGKVTSKPGAGVASKHVLSSSPPAGKKLVNGAKVKVVVRQ